MITKVWKDPVWSKVIATVILAVIGAISAYFLNWWPSIKNAVISLFSFLGSTTEIRNWLIGLMVICAVLVIFVVVVVLWKLIFPSEQKANWKNYISDNFFGLEWHWRYGSDGSIYNLYSCCSNCHYQVFPEDVSSYSAVPRTTFRCDSCGSKTGDFEETQRDLESKVKRFIQQKLRTGSWLSSENT